MSEQADEDDKLEIREIREDDEEWKDVVVDKDTGERVFADELAVEKCAPSSANACLLHHRFLGHGAVTCMVQLQPARDIGHLQGKGGHECSCI